MEHARHVAQRAQRGRGQVVADADDGPHERAQALPRPPARRSAAGAAAPGTAAGPLRCTRPALCLLIIAVRTIPCAGCPSLRLALAAAALLLAALAGPGSHDLEQGCNTAAPLGAACSQTGGSLPRVLAAAF